MLPVRTHTYRLGNIDIVPGNRCILCQKGEHVQIRWRGGWKGKEKRKNGTREAAESENTFLYLLLESDGGPVIFHSLLCYRVFVFCIWALFSFLVCQVTWLHHCAFLRFCIVPNPYGYCPVSHPNTLDWELGCAFWHLAISSCRAVWLVSQSSKSKKPHSGNFSCR